MQITLCNQQQWHKQASRQLPVQIRPHVFRFPQGRQQTIQPRLAEYTDIQILAADWLAVTPKGFACYEGMVHTPGLFPEKSRSLIATPTGYAARPSKETHTDTPLILVGGSANHYHWLIDYLPRLLIAESFSEYENWQIVVNADLAPAQLASMELLDIDPKRILRLHPTESLRAHRVLIPSLLSHSTLCHPAVPVMLRKVFPPSTPVSKGHKRILISRADASTRRLTNETELQEALEPWGFECVRLGNMDFQAQIDLFAQAEIVVGAHGAGLSNLVFCNPGATVVEIAHFDRKVSSMKVLAMLMGLKHHFVPASTSPPVRHANPLLNDWQADISAVRKVLQMSHPLTRGL